jgi:TPR repeat protein
MTLPRQLDGPTSQEEVREFFKDKFGLQESVERWADARELITDPSEALAKLLEYMTLDSPGLSCPLKNAPNLPTPIHYFQISKPPNLDTRMILVDYPYPNTSFRKRRWMYILVLSLCSLVIHAPCYANEGNNNAQDILMYRKAAEQGNARAQTRLGKAYAFGEGISRDDTEAVAWWQKAAKLGDAEAQTYLGTAYYIGKGVPKDASLAVDWYQKAAAQGSVPAQYALGLAFKDGFGRPQDSAEAVKWFRKAAENGVARAQNDLGNAYHHGKGIEKDDVEAVKWFRKAAEQGNTAAEFNLGVMYRSGSGVPQDNSKAVEWYRQAADQGYVLAQNNLSYMYRNGFGVSTNMVEAYLSSNLAAAQKDAKALSIVSELEKSMTADEIAEGKRRAAEWKPTPHSNSETQQQ